MHRSPAEQAEFIKRVEDRGGTAAMIAIAEAGPHRYLIPASFLTAINERFEYLESQRDEARAELAKLQGLSRRKQARVDTCVDVMDR